MKQSKAKKAAPIKELTTIVLPASQLAASKARIQRPTSQPNPVAAPTLAPKKKHKVSKAQLIELDEPAPVATPGKGKVTMKHKVDAIVTAMPFPMPPPPATELSGTAEKISPVMSLMPTLKRGRSRSRAGSLSQPSIKSGPAPTSEIFDPLICAPATESELHCKCNLKIPVFTSSP
jgi:hypothetical protein